MIWWFVILIPTQIYMYIEISTRVRLDAHKTGLQPIQQIVYSSSSSPKVSS